MSIDLQNSIDEVKNRVSALKTTNQVLNQYDQIKKEVKDNLEKEEQKVIEAIDKIKDEKKRLKRQLKGQLENLLDIFQMNAGSGLDSLGYVKSRFVQILNKIQPILQKLIKETMIDCIGCSQEQTYDPSQPIYIKISSIDVSGMIKNFRPDLEEGAVLYESKITSNNQFPYSMNREIWNRTQKLGQDFRTDNGGLAFIGKSGQELFNMEYTKTGPAGETGDFLKIDLVSRLNNINNVTSFLYDYYTSIQVIDINAIYTQLIEILFGGISINFSLGYGEVEIKNKVALIIQRILGLCYDARNEIDVSGVAKVPELDGLDDSFFEFSGVDQRIIESKVSNTLTGVVEFEDCDNIKLPIDTKPMMKALQEITFVAGGGRGDLDKLGNDLTKSITNNPEWKFRIPTSFNVDLKINADFILNIPKAIVMALLSPKVLLPLFIMFKAIGNNISDLIEDFVDFFKKFRKCLAKLISKIGAIFIRELFQMIKRDLMRLLSKLVKEISKEKAAKKYVLIAKLVAILAFLIKAFIDWRQCKSVIDEIIMILNIIMLGKGKDSGISPVLAAAGSSLPGYSPTRAFAETVQAYESAGIPTGPMPSGSPNVGLISDLLKYKANDKEMTNMKGTSFVPSLSVTPYGTIPTTISVISNSA